MKLTLFRPCIKCLHFEWPCPTTNSKSFMRSSSPGDCKFFPLSRMHLATLPLFSLCTHHRSRDLQAQSSFSVLRLDILQAMQVPDALSRTKKENVASHVHKSADWSSKGNLFLRCTPHHPHRVLGCIERSLFAEALRGGWHHRGNKETHSQSSIAVMLPDSSTRIFFL